MKQTLAAISFSAAIGAVALAQAEMPKDPDVAAFAKMAALNQVVAKRCPGIAMNEKVVSVWVAALSMTGKYKQFEAITPAEAQAMIAEAEKEMPATPEGACQKVREMMVSDPTGSGKQAPLFIEKK